MSTVVGFEIRVLDGECEPVPGLELGARYKYEHNPSTWTSATTDGDGLARFRDEHSEAPLQVDVYLGDSFAETFPVIEDSTVILEV